MALEIRRQNFSLGISLSKVLDWVVIQSFWFPKGPVIIAHCLKWVPLFSEIFAFVLSKRFAFCYFFSFLFNNKISLKINSNKYESKNYLLKVLYHNYNNNSNNNNNNNNNNKIAKVRLSTSTTVCSWKWMTQRESPNLP